MNHNFYSDDLKAYLDGELPIFRRTLLRRHLAHCAACREEMTIMENLGNELQAANISAEEMPAALRAKLLTGAPTTAPKSTPESARGYRPSWKDGALIAGLGIMLFAIISPTFYRARENARRSPSREVFNVANNALTTGGDVGDYAVDSPVGGASGAAVDSQVPQAAPSAVGNTAGGNYLSADGHVRFTQRNDAQSRPQAKSETSILDNTSRAASEPKSAAPSAESGTGEDIFARRVHKEGSIAVEVQNVETQTEQAIDAVRGSEGFVASNDLSTSASGARTAVLEVRVPVAKFESVMKKIADLGTVKAKKISGEDVTAQWANSQTRAAVLNDDLTAREEQLRLALARAQKKKNSEIPWQLRSEVRELRIQAAQARARLQFVRHISELSNISIQLREKVAVPGSGGFLENVGQTWSEAGKTFGVAARIPVNCLIWILAYSPLWLPFLIGWRVLAKSQKRAL